MRRPKVGERYQLRGTQIVAEVTHATHPWIGLFLEDEANSMNWRIHAMEFERRWAKVETADADIR